MPLMHDGYSQGHTNAIDGMAGITRSTMYETIIHTQSPHMQS